MKYRATHLLGCSGWDLFSCFTERDPGSFKLWCNIHVTNFVFGIFSSWHPTSWGLRSGRERGPVLKKTHIPSAGCLHLFGASVVVSMATGVKIVGMCQRYIVQSGADCWTRVEGWTGHTGSGRGQRRLAIISAWTPAFRHRLLCCLWLSHNTRGCKNNEMLHLLLNDILLVLAEKSGAVSCHYVIIITYLTTDITYQ